MEINDKHVPAIDELTGLPAPDDVQIASEAKTAPPCYVSFCCAEKRPDEGDLPAIERYTASRVHDVYRWARRDSADFRIFSGLFGLLSASDPIPWYDHVLQLEEVPHMAVRVATQLEEQCLHRLVVYTSEVEKDPGLLIYLGCLQVAAGSVGDVTVEHREMTGDGW